VNKIDHKQEIVRVMIAEDHAVVREGLAAIIDDEPDMEVIALAANGSEALELYRRERPDVAVMDLQMPVMDGADAIAAIKGEHPGARFVVLTTYDGDEDIYRALRAGAQGYLLKDSPPDQLLGALRAVHSGRKLIPPEIAQKLAERVDGDHLTEREGEVLRLIVTGKTNADIARELFIAESTVKFHVNHILAKLGVGDRSQAIIVALKRGLAHL
jgi:DNA-binding NarL/FixJ family response regulator